MKRAVGLFKCGTGYKESVEKRGRPKRTQCEDAARQVKEGNQITAHNGVLNLCFSLLISFTVKLMGLVISKERVGREGKLWS